MIHKEQSELAGKTVKIKADAGKHPHVENFAGSDYDVEDWWDRLGQGPWGSCNGNRACIVYATRTGLPFDDEVLYGKIGRFGHLVHISEIELPEPASL